MKYDTKTLQAGVMVRPGSFEQWRGDEMKHKQHCEFCETDPTMRHITGHETYGDRWSCDVHRHWVRRLMRLDGVECIEESLLPISRWSSRRKNETI